MFDPIYAWLGFFRSDDNRGFGFEDYKTTPDLCVLLKEHGLSGLYEWAWRDVVDDGLSNPHLVSRARSYAEFMKFVTVYIRHHGHGYEPVQTDIDAEFARRWGGRAAGPIHPPDDPRRVLSETHDGWDADDARDQTMAGTIEGGYASAWANTLHNMYRIHDQKQFDVFIRFKRHVDDKRALYLGEWPDDDRDAAEFWQRWDMRVGIRVTDNQIGVCGRWRKRKWPAPTCPVVVSSW
jgi:hypothetical protein